MGKSREKPVIIFILGPTAVGKSELAVRLARRIGGEIISCDSMQIYKGLNITSQQPSSELRKLVPHHLVGVLSRAKEWSAASFAIKARKIAGDIVKRNKIPIVIGGSGLYARALIKGLFPSPPKDKNLRRRLYKEAERRGKERLYHRLLKIDSTYGSRIHSNDLRRIVRALEVYSLTGRPISEQNGMAMGIKDKYNVYLFILNRDRPDLYRRINRRVEKMFADGIVREVKKLQRYRISQTAKAVLGYREVSDFIKERYSLEETKELLKKNTRHYAKRQLTWFRKEEGAKWLDLSTKKEAALVNTIVKRVKTMGKTFPV